MDCRMSCQDISLSALSLTSLQKTVPPVARPSWVGRAVAPASGGLRLADQPPSLVRPALKAPERPWFERIMPQPPHDIRTDLARDRCLRTTLQDPEHSTRFYHQQVQCRRQCQQDNEEYRFAPFLVTLENMSLLVDNILANQQFREPLDARERGAFLTLKGLILRLITQQAPYKRTVRLALLMTCMLEIMTARHVVAALHDSDSLLLKKGRLKEFPFFPRCEGLEDDEDPVAQPAAGIDLDRVLACRWGELNPTGRYDEQAELFDDYCGLGSELEEWLENPALFVYPSFEPLDPEDFCRFAHLPVYPLGLITGYALNADGVMRTPMSFLLHDFVHASSGRIWEYLEGARPLENLASRLALRTLVLDELPVAIRTPGLESAVVLVLFHLFHERMIFESRQELGSANFVPLLHRICTIRRMRSCDYPDVYRQIGDWEALLACHWVHWMYNRGLRDHPLRSCDIKLLATRFVAQEVPLLRGQWDFFDGHRQEVRDWLAAREQVRTLADGSRNHCYKSRSDYAKARFDNAELVFWQEYNAHCEGPVDYTDLAWFDVLYTPGDGRRMLQELALQTVDNRGTAGRLAGPTDSRVRASRQQEQESPQGVPDVVHSGSRHHPCPPATAC